MKTKLVSLLASLLLLLGTASAQDGGVVVVESDSPYYAGASFGFVSASGFSSLTLAGHFGLRDLLLEDLDLRLDATVLTRGGNSFSLGALALYNLDLSSLPVDIYFGGGPELFFGSNTAFGIGLRGGADYAISQRATAFGEFRVDPVFGNANTTLFGLGAGIKFSF
ncbi:MAG: hypothetical protein U5L04_16450 [Trueperaceae bacterium]|nr:hypothetical protein [Trueperaceae bacterium]